MTMGYAKKNRRHGKEDSDRMTLTDGDSLEDTARVEPTTSSSRPSLETSSGDDTVASSSPPTVDSPVQGESPLPSTHASDAPMPCNANEDEHHVVSIPPRVHVTAGTSDTTTVPVDLVECDDTIDEDDYNFRLKYRTEMTWQLVYFLIWNLLARHSWGLWIEFAGVVLAYSAVGVAGSLNPTRYPASWCLWSVRCYLWLNPLVQVYNALWFGRLFFLDNVFWFTYVTMLLNFGVLYCGYVSASEYYDNDLVHFMQRHFAASPSSGPKVDGDTDSSVAVDVGIPHHRVSLAEWVAFGKATSLFSLDLTEFLVTMDTYADRIHRHYDDGGHLRPTTPQNQPVPVRHKLPPLLSSKSKRFVRRDKSTTSLQLKPIPRITNRKTESCRVM
ncbi:hypothetical protein DYB35_013816 [Aphanomyces astaci]|uniref:Uncharacterized protein n=1 Tax=Aphanomyces astaci TaxID=112090 RepID=A0A418CPQ7_APHAT|nr:hypothetical protein DYB35_013816 [Aphanomyces astaci]